MNRRSLNLGGYGQFPPSLSNDFVSLLIQIHEHSACQTSPLEKYLGDFFRFLTLHPALCSVDKSSLRKWKASGLIHLVCRLAAQMPNPFPYGGHLAYHFSLMALGLKLGESGLPKRYANCLVFPCEV